MSTSDPPGDLSTLRQDLAAQVHDQLQLAALEVRLATQSLMTMIAAAVCMGTVLVVAWVALMGATGLGLVGMGLEPAAALLVLALANAVLAGLLRVLIRRRSRDLGLPASLRALKPPPSKARHGETT